MMSFVGVVRHCRESRPAGYSVRNGSKDTVMGRAFSLTGGVAVPRS
jgi:hypothetical protein